MYSDVVKILQDTEFPDTITEHIENLINYYENELASNLKKTNPEQVIAIYNRIEGLRMAKSLITMENECKTCNYKLTNANCCITCLTCL